MKEKLVFVKLPYAYEKASYKVFAPLQISIVFSFFKHTKVF